MLTVQEASSRILSSILPMATEHVAIGAALGRVLASSVTSPISLPPWDNSSMDGYALRAADVAGASAEHPIVLPVVETVAAGHAATQPCLPGTATRIMTGAPVPEGADSVIRVEDTDGGTHRVAVRDARDAGRNVRPRGEDVQAGELAVASGTLLGPAHVGVLASVGAATVETYRNPRVAVLATGDELVDVHGFFSVRRGEKIVSSNSYSIGAAVRAAGGELVDLGIAPDDPAELRRRIELASGCDLLLTTGGVSVGAFDYTREVLEALGADLKLWRVSMRPGAPIGFGLLGSTPWLGLPGNPVSALVTFELFARPAIKKQRGERLLFRRSAPVILDEPVTLAAPLTHFLRAVVERTGDEPLHARLTGPQGSGLLTSMARANALLVVAPDRPSLQAGQTARALLLANEDNLAAELVLA